LDSFKSTLTVVKEAELLIHVVDAAAAMPQMHINTVHEILEQIEAKIPELLVFNKIDRIDRASLNYLKEKYPDAEFISSTVGTNIPNLINRIFEKVLGEIVKEQVIISAKDLDILHKLSTIHNVENIDSQLIVEIDIRKQYLNNLIDKDIVKISI
jgi:50S ribosomal subunit-associated GTPase HflX